MSKATIKKQILRKENYNTKRNHHLITSDPFFRQIIDSIEDYAIFTTDKTGIVNSWNSGSERIFGFKEKEIVGQNAEILFIPEDREKKKPEKELRIARTKGKATDDKWHIRRDKSRFWASGLVFPLKNDQGSIYGFTKIARNLTKQKKYDEERITLLQELNIERKKLLNIFERAPTFMAIVRGENHVFEMANKAYYQLVGHRDIIGKSVKEALPEVIDQGFIKLLDNVLGTGKPYIGNEIPVALQRKKGSKNEERFVNFVYEPLKDIKGKRVGIVGHGYDVTDQVIARQKIQESEERFRSVWDSVSDAIAISDKKGIVINANPAYFTLYQLPKEKIIDKDFSVIFSKNKRALARKKYKEIFVGEKKSDTVETEIKRIDGSIRIVESSYDFILHKEERVALVSTIRDITERKRLERQKDDFLGIASHELKTPVTSIKAYGQVLEALFRRKGDIKAAEQLLKMDAQVDRLNNLIGDLLDVTKIQSGRLQFHESYFNFNELVKEIVEEVQRTTTKHQIKKELGKTKNIHGDKERIGQVLTNLITNAIKYSPHSDKIIVTTTSTNKIISLCVKDFGVGIPKDKQKKVFEQFFRVSGPKQDTFPGLGLGLYISSEIIKREGGKIWVESREGKGSTFCFSLPINKSTIKQQKNELADIEMQHA